MSLKSDLEASRGRLEAALKLLAAEEKDLTSLAYVASTYVRKAIAGAGAAMICVASIIRGLEHEQTLAEITTEDLEADEERIAMAEAEEAPAEEHAG